MRSSHFAFSLCLMAAYGWVATVQAAELTPATVWTSNFAQAQAEAARLHRPLVVHFHTNTCPPCRKMEKEVLHTPQVLKLLDKGFVAVKVDMYNAANAKVVAKYKIEVMPTDLVLSHDGKVLSTSKGYREGPNGDRQKYLKALAKIDADYTAEGKRLPHAETTLVATQEAPAAKDPATVVANSTPGNKLVPEPVEPRIIGESTTPAADVSPAKPAVEVEQLVVALDGYCPVTLRTTRTWKKGDQQFAWSYDGQTFLFQAADKRDEFKADPTRYAPKLLGCDPVVLAENNLAIRGSTKFGAFYEGELFLFESADTRSKFRKEPTRFIHLKHVLKPEDVKDAKDAKDVRKLAVTATK
jgi:YHS domain-containing protein/thiol-disulfide isomerase/thioredoxin